MPDTQQTHFISTIKATKDIAAGQEIFIRYGSMKWFEHRNIPRADTDYASTMWRPDLHPLPCRQSIAQTTGADGRHSFAVREAVPSGTVLEISLCLEVSANVVDQFPFLRDFVLTGESEHERVNSLPTDFCLLARTHRLCVCRSRRSDYWRTCCEGSVFPSSTHSQPVPKPALILSPSWG